MFGSRRKPEDDALKRRLDELSAEAERLAEEMERIQAGSSGRVVEAETDDDEPPYRLRRELRAQRARDRNLFIFLFVVLALIVYGLAQAIS